MQRRVVLSAILCTVLLVAVSSCSRDSHVSEPALEFADAADVGAIRDSLDRISSSLSHFVESGKVPNLLTLVARSGKIIHWEALGYREIESADPLEKDDIFRIYSMTKPITAAATMILVERGQVRLDEPVSTYLPGFDPKRVLTQSGSYEQAERSITIRDLLRHTSGLTYGDEGGSIVDSLYAVSGIFDAPDLSSFADSLLALPLAVQPGTVFNYGVSYGVLGLAIETVSGMPFPEFLRSELFQPLGMDDTSFVLGPEKRQRLVSRYLYSDSLSVTADPDNESNGSLQVDNFPYGGGGLYSTPSDFLRFCQMILNQGELDGVRVMSEESIQEMSRDQLPAGAPLIEAGPGHGNVYGYGLGFATLLDAEATPEADYNGVIRWAGLANTYFWIDPEAELVAMVWTQLDPFFVHDFVTPFQELVYSSLE